MKKAIVDKWILDPANSFFQNSSTSGLLLFASAAIAIILSNSPLSDAFHHIWELQVGVSLENFELRKELHHWINDGLMAVFFFVIGLELKRELVGGELRNPRNAVLPIVAGIGGMVVPALIYMFFNRGGYGADGWGVPMATDIAFALGVLYLLGDRVPVSLKVFLTVLAIADDLGAVLVIAIFYTSEISAISLYTGMGFMAILIGANLIGVRSPLFYGIFGIGGLWLAFLMSGIHATVAAVLAAFTIPAQVKLSANGFTDKMEKYTKKFREARTNKNSLVTNEQLHVIENIRYYSKAALTPLQRLEHAMHPLVAFVIMPIFALANAGIDLRTNTLENLISPVSIGIFLGLIVGKLVGIVGFTIIAVKLKLTQLPKGLTLTHITGAAMLASIGFTMSLFIAGLAFKDMDTITQAKLGTITASLIGGTIGYLLIRKACLKAEQNTTKD
jgi:Na+:H+ antiporter, NhaA family